MILLDDVIEALDLARLDRHITVLVYVIHGRFVDAILVHRDLRWLSVLAHRLFDKSERCHCIALGTQQEIDGGTSLL
jgi:hypothetical protein